MGQTGMSLSLVGAILIADSSKQTNENNCLPTLASLMQCGRPKDGGVST
jgi:hypothetical protein